MTPKSGDFCCYCHTTIPVNWQKIVWWPGHSSREARRPRTSVATSKRLAPRARLMLEATPCHPVWLAELGSNGPNTRLQLLPLSGEMSQRRPAARVSSPSTPPDPSF
jgi:hypothetical protein